MSRSRSPGALPVVRTRVFPIAFPIAFPIVFALAAALCASLLVALPAAADGRLSGHDRFLATARVIDVRPVYTDVRVRAPRLECAPSRRPTRVDVYERPRGGHRYDRGHGRAYGHDYRRGVSERRAAVVGGLVGGVVGNRIARDGSRDRRIAGTVAGAVVGSTLGAARERGHARPRARVYERRHDRGYRHGHRHPRRVTEYGRGRAERCVRVVDTRRETRLDHYDVTYVFRGRTFHARRAFDPGSTIEIDVSVSPAYR